MFLNILQLWAKMSDIRIGQENYFCIILRKIVVLHEIY
jgi:hypothetical protein